jgi:hypothetical protein
LLSAAAASLLVLAAVAAEPLSATASADAPPVARLSVTRASSTSLKITADGSASTDADATPIQRYRFRFGDGSHVRTFAPTDTVTHTYGSPGVYTVRLRAVDTARQMSTNPAVVTIAVSTGGDPVAVYAGYYDTHHGGDPQPKPSPWGSSSDVVFVAHADSSSGGWDTAAVRVDNTSGTTLSDVEVTVDIGSHHFALWGSHDLAPGETLIVAQTDFENFDGSDLNDAGCYSCDPDMCEDPSSTVPEVTVTIDGDETTYLDEDQVLNTNGVDSAGCPYTGDRNDESTTWTSIG